MTDTQYLNSFFDLGSNSWLSGRSGIYIQKIYDTVQTHAIYGIYRKDFDYWKKELSKNKGINRFRKINANGRAYAILCFKYNPDKDENHPEFN